MTAAVALDWDSLANPSGGIAVARLSARRKRPIGQMRLETPRLKKEGPDLHPALKALGNGGVSSREDGRMVYPQGKEMVNGDAKACVKSRFTY
jgi:hypothetical protein